MNDYKAFLKEIFALEVRTVELFTRPGEKLLEVNGESLPYRYIEILPLSYINPSRVGDDIKKNLLKHGHKIGKYWDLTHYAMGNFGSYIDAYTNKLDRMRSDASTDVAGNPQQIEAQLNIVNQHLQRFSEVVKRFYSDKMFQYMHSFANAFPQDELRHHYLSLFTCEGIGQKHSGYSPEFIEQFFEILIAKKGALEALKTHMTAIVGGTIERKELPVDPNALQGIVDAPIKKFGFDEKEGWKEVSENADSGNINSIGNNPIDNNIHDYLIDYKDAEKITEADFIALKQILHNYFHGLPQSDNSKMVRVKAAKKKLASDLCRLYKAIVDGPLKYEYLVLLATHINKFKDDLSDENDFRGSKLYKYLTSNTQ